MSQNPREMRYLLLLLVLGGVVWAAPPQADPVSALKHYYQLLSQRDLLDAYQLRSASSRKSLTPEAFAEIWSNNVQVTASGFALAPPDTVHFTVKSVDFDKTTGAREESEYAGTARLLREKNLWWVDDVQVQKLSSNPVRGLELAPGQSVVAGKTPEPLPAEIPVYAGFRMSPPLLIKGPGVPQGERAVVSSNRQPRLKPIQVADFYQQTLGAAGWKTSGPAGGSSSVGLTFTKASRRVTISIYTGIYEGTDVVGDPRGTRLEIRY